uniref:Protein MAIN-LIKE 2-like n=1 Tax=Cicer arietinum TaxID=3827 RepID=A0A1S2Z196_CICAR|nr:protein MAIN-LIKE 2-like [Cicer arietinum]
MEKDAHEYPQMEQTKEEYAAHTDDIHDADDVSAHANDIHDADEQDQQPGFPGGPVVTHVLIQYEHHMARRLWEGELKKFVEVHVPALVQHWIPESGLLHLSSAYITMADVGLISAFVERWYRETSSFNFFFGEMTITLDDVDALLHI